MLPNHRLLAKAFHRPSRATVSATYINVSAHSHVVGLVASSSHTRAFYNYTSPSHHEKPAKGIGSKPKDHVTRGRDDHNIQIDNSRAGREAKKNGNGGCATTEKDIHHSAASAKKKIPEAPTPILGMNDERGAVSWYPQWGGNRFDVRNRNRNECLPIEVRNDKRSAG